VVTSQLQKIKLVEEAISHHFAELLLQARSQDAVGWIVSSLLFLVEDSGAYAIRCRLFDIKVHQLLVDSKPMRDLKVLEALRLFLLNISDRVYGCALDLRYPLGNFRVQAKP
jgi:hypothetical protein